MVGPELLPTVKSGGFLGRRFHQTLNGRRQLRTNALPVGEAILIDVETNRSARGDRVVEADALDEATVATIARVSGNDVVERALLGAATG